MLNDLLIKATKPSEKPMKLYDSRGLYLLVTPAGGKLWRFKYRFAGKERLLALGKYPDLSLKEARNTHTETRLPSGRSRHARDIAVAAAAYGCLSGVFAGDGGVAFSPHAGSPSQRVTLYGMVRDRL